MSEHRSTDSNFPGGLASSRCFRRPLWLWVSVSIFLPLVTVSALFAYWRLERIGDEPFFSKGIIFLSSCYFLSALIVAIPTIIWIVRHQDSQAVSRLDLFLLVVGCSGGAAIVVPFLITALALRDMGLLLDPEAIFIPFISLFFGAAIFVPSAIIFALIVVKRVRL